jgi:signal transduction histidine kinase
LAHGLKTPLTILASDAEELRTRGEINIADEIAAVTDGMRRHVERELARARAGTRLRSVAAQAVNPVVDQVLAVLRRTPRGQSLRWEVEVAQDLAAPIDAQDLAEIVGNLGENALKWAASKIRIAGREEEGAVLVSVEDDGPGIPEDQIGTVLARGGRLDETQPGSGLGLAIVADLTEAYSGSLAVGRSPLGGLSAAVRLPLCSEGTNPLMRASAL